MKTYRVTAPVEPHADREILRWLTRESFEVKIHNDGLVLVDYTESEVDAKDVSKAARELYPDAQWIRFEATAKLPDDVQAMVDAIKGPSLRA